MKIQGLGEFRVLTLRETAPDRWQPGENAAQCALYWRQHIATDPRFNGEVETFWCLVLNCRRKIVGCFLVSTGTLDTLLVHPREVFRPAILASAAAIVLMHCHPSGDPAPSEGDIKVTRDLQRAGQLLKIEVLDHVIMGLAIDGRPKDFVSLRDLGFLMN